MNGDLMSKVNSTGMVAYNETIPVELQQYIEAVIMDTLEGKISFNDEVDTLTNYCSNFNIDSHNIVLYIDKIIKVVGDASLTGSSVACEIAKELCGQKYVSNKFYDTRIKKFIKSETDKKKAIDEEKDNILKQADASRNAFNQLLEEEKKKHRDNAEFNSKLKIARYSLISGGCFIVIAIIAACCGKWGWWLFAPAIVSGILLMAQVFRPKNIFSIKVLIKVFASYVLAIGGAILFQKWFIPLLVMIFGGLACGIILYTLSENDIIDVDNLE